jgi:hypothetical protein
VSCSHDATLEHVTLRTLHEHESLSTTASLALSNGQHSSKQTICAAQLDV